MDTRTDTLLIEKKSDEADTDTWDVVVSIPVNGRLYGGMTSRREWENLEEELERLHDRESWGPGTYRVTLTWVYSGRTTSITRDMPLPPFYAKLPFSGGGYPNTGPVRAYLRTLLSQYPGSTLELISQHFAAFDMHYQVEASSAALAEATGYAVPDGTERPYNVHQNRYHHRSDIPAELQ
jgi:hypothetical protein